MFVFSSVLINLISANVFSHLKMLNLAHTIPLFPYLFNFPKIIMTTWCKIHIFFSKNDFFPKKEYTIFSLHAIG